MSKLFDLIKVKEQLNNAEITILKQIAESEHLKSKAHIEQVSDIPTWIFVNPTAKPIQVNITSKDNLPLITHTIEQARKHGNIEYIIMSGKTLRDLTLSPLIDKLMDIHAIPRQDIIDQKLLESIFDTIIRIDHKQIGIMIHTTKDTEVTWD